MSRLHRAEQFLAPDLDESPRLGVRPKPAPQLLNGPAVCRLLGIDRHTWRRWVVNQQAPAPVPHVPGHPRWRVRDIEDFIRGAYGTGRYFFTARGR